jgi:hypothetical protein
MIHVKTTEQLLKTQLHAAKNERLIELISNAVLLLETIRTPRYLIDSHQLMHSPPIFRDFMHQTAKKIFFYSSANT